MNTAIVTYLLIMCYTAPTVIGDRCMEISQFNTQKACTDAKDMLNKHAEGVVYTCDEEE